MARPARVGPELAALALGLAATVVVRALVTRRASDAALAAFSTPVLTVAVWGVIEHYVAAGGGLRPGGLASVVAGTLLAAVALAAAGPACVARRRVERDSTRTGRRSAPDRGALRGDSACRGDATAVVLG